MSHHAGAAQGLYKPLPNPVNQSSPDLGDHHYSEQDIGSFTPTFEHPQFDLESPMPLDRPRFLGSAGGENPGYRDSMFSHNSHPQSEADSSVYALNPETPGSARDSPVPRSEYGAYRDDPRASYPDEDSSVPMAQVGTNRYLSEKRGAYASPRPLKSKRNIFIIGGIVVAVVIAIAIAVPVAINAKKSSSQNLSSSGGNSSSSSSSGSGSSSGSSPSSKTVVVTGGDGSTVTMDDGSTFTYTNSFGGTWYFDENDPFNNAARAQSWSPALNETFNWGVDKIRG